MKAKILFRDKTPIRIYIEEDFDVAEKDKDFLVNNTTGKYSLVESKIISSIETTGYKPQTVQEGVVKFLNMCEPSFKREQTYDAYEAVKENISSTIIAEEFKAIFYQYLDNK